MLMVPPGGSRIRLPQRLSSTGHRMIGPAQASFCLIRPIATKHHGMWRVEQRGKIAV
jgi:hypothetical protein